MGKEITGLITFKSTHHTIQAEEFFRNRSISFKTVPTPREITRSCGLAIMFSLDHIHMVKEMIDKGEINIDSVYEYIKDGTSRHAEKII
ncbi:MAG TPA: DUF3343 domain-containing protein [Tissierellaceae bacterium]|nr:DUF3343 domain-containing protein [Tissierellaceae bacterium]